MAMNKGFATFLAKKKGTVKTMGKKAMNKAKGKMMKGKGK